MSFFAGFKLKLAPSFSLRICELRDPSFVIFPLSGFGFLKRADYLIDAAERFLGVLKCFENPYVLVISSGLIMLVGVLD